MAATLAARRLTEAHRVRQARLGARTILAMRAIWQLLDPDDLDGSFETWLAAALPIIEGQHRESARLAANYLAVYKQLELGRGDVQVVLAAPDRDAVRTSLLVTGPLSVKRAMTRGVLLPQAVSTAARASAAAAMRHSLEGGRDTITQTVRADRDARGYARVASSGACDFCSTLAGKLMTDENTFPAHDGCSCTSEPVYR